METVEAAAANTYKQIEEEGKKIELPSTKLPDKALIDKYVSGLASKADGMDPRLGQCLKVVQPAVVLVTQLAMCIACLLYTSPSPRDRQKSRMPSSA